MVWILLRSESPAPQAGAPGERAVPVQPCDELLRTDGAPRAQCRAFRQRLEAQSTQSLAHKRPEADTLFHTPALPLRSTARPRAPNG